MNIFAAIMSFFGFGALQTPPPPPPHTYLVQPTMVADEKAVFATVQSANVVPARARIGGTIIELKVRQGDSVLQGQVIATISDKKLGFQASSYGAQVAATQAQLAGLPQMDPVKAKAIVAAFYGSGPKRAYFSSCSNGGRQALMEAQRYPEDYDGIIAGAPANYWTKLMLHGMSVSRATAGDPESTSNVRRARAPATCPFGSDPTIGSRWACDQP